MNFTLKHLLMSVVLISFGTSALYAGKKKNFSEQEYREKYGKEAHTFKVDESLESVFPRVLKIATKCFQDFSASGSKGFQSRVSSTVEKGKTPNIRIAGTSNNQDERNSYFAIADFESTSKTTVQIKLYFKKDRMQKAFERWINGSSEACPEVDNSYF